MKDDRRSKGSKLPRDTEYLRLGDQVIQWHVHRYTVARSPPDLVKGQPDAGVEDLQVHRLWFGARANAFVREEDTYTIECFFASSRPDSFLRLLASVLFLLNMYVIFKQGLLVIERSDVRRQRSDVISAGRTVEGRRGRYLQTDLSE